jgi:hypothetical protein
MSQLTSNGVPIPFDDRHFAPMLDSTDLLADAEALRSRYVQDGYLFVRGVLEADRLRQLRGRYFSAFEPGYLQPGTEPADGVFSGVRPDGLPPHGVEGHPAHALVRSQAFRDFAASRPLARLAETVLGGPSVLLPRQIVRHFDRSVRRASRAHVDFRYLDQGSSDLVTMWVPIGDCPVRTGALVYLEGSHRLGPDELAAVSVVTDRPGDDRPLSHDLAWVADQLGRRWLWADFAAGDVTVHSPHVVHASLDTESDVMRMSADVRFLRAGETPDPRWLVPWAGDDGN